MNNVNIVDGKADFGGAIYASGSTLILNDCNFSNNIATTNGGAFYLSQSTTLTATNCKFLNNKATAQYNPYGGAFYVTSSTLNFISCTFDKNEAAYGSAVYAMGSDFSAKNSNFTYNKGQQVGTLYLYSSNVFIDNSLFENNTSKVSSLNSVLLQQLHLLIVLLL